MEEGFIVNSELYRLLMEYEGLDDDFIQIAYELIMKDEESLKPFISKMIITDKDGNSLGSYSNDTGVIRVHKNNILTNRPEIKNKKILALQVIRHEIEHARNIQRLHEMRKDIESTLLRYSLRDYVQEHRLDVDLSRYYDKQDYFSLFMRFKRIENYDRDPGERIAEIKAWKYMVNLLKNQRRTEDLLVARSNLFYSYIRGYEDNGWYLNPPTYEFLLRMGMYQDYYFLKKRVEEEQYVFDTRLMYGLPLIKGEEYDDKVLKKVLLQKSKRQ